MHFLKTFQVPYQHISGHYLSLSWKLPTLICSLTAKIRYVLDRSLRKIFPVLLYIMLKRYLIDESRKKINYLKTTRSLSSLAGRKSRGNPPRNFR